MAPRRASVAERERVAAPTNLPTQASTPSPREPEFGSRSFGFGVDIPNWSFTEGVEREGSDCGKRRAHEGVGFGRSAREDGIMTAELLQRLFGEQQIKSSSSTNFATILNKEGTNGTAIASLTEISEIEQKVVKEEGSTEAEGSNILFPESRNKRFASSLATLMIWHVRFLLMEFLEWVEE
ncbi:hypothetical protein F3Y22_tig00110332pilonHSYRG00099 [Hibiscus syriacus]|uniref:Uncharacterized protein n=1 Tax=Hibiscus syriacus TaxID=106335 RepID=A0A6A3B085_HIBSY|nr:hypothetical protein F3Y22_tig00110332pilonHSYRG00099 [Hibiscus syriacus]